jgi:hypothetical protein
LEGNSAGQLIHTAKHDKHIHEVRPIREEQEYGGQRVSLLVLLGNARIRLQLLILMLILEKSSTAKI